MATSATADGHQGRPASAATATYSGDATYAGVTSAPAGVQPCARGENDQPGWAAAGSGPAGAGPAVPRARPDSRFAAAAWKREMSP